MAKRVTLPVLGMVRRLRDAILTGNERQADDLMNGSYDDRTDQHFAGLSELLAKLPATEKEKDRSQWQRLWHLEMMMCSGRQLWEPSWRESLLEAIEDVLVTPKPRLADNTGTATPSQKRRKRGA